MSFSTVQKNLFVLNQLQNSLSLPKVYIYSYAHDDPKYSVAFIFQFCFPVSYFGQKVCQGFTFPGSPLFVRNISRLKKFHKLVRVHPAYLITEGRVKWNDDRFPLSSI